MAQNALTVTVISPEATLYSGTAGAVFLPGSVAPFEVLPVRDAGGEEHRFAIASGVVKVSHDKLTACIEVK